MRKLTHAEIAGKRLTPAEIGSIRRFPLTVLLDNVRSLYNVGSIFRSADGARVGELILTGYTPTPPRREIEKTALGSTSTVPWRYEADPVAAALSLKRSGVRICVVEHTDCSRPYHALGPADLMEHLAGRLPPYALPAKLTVTEDFPRTSTGKIDRRALQSQAAQPAPS